VTPDQTRERLLASAAALFARKGLNGATLAEIAADAGLSTGAVYGLFTGKAELFAAAVEARAEAELDRVLRSEAVGGSVTSMLRARGEALNTRSGHEGALLIQAIMAADHDPALVTHLAASLAAREQHLTGLVEAAQAAGELDDGLPARAAVRFLAMLGLGATLLGVLDVDPVPAEEWSELIRRLVDAVARGNGPPPADGAAP
jgi:AcrR family transcriptional regulator